ncbi:MAG: phenylalanine--tRNA ligase subunit beta [Candidatus Brocadiia bacterium]
MLISYNWLNDICPHGLAAHELADRLSHAGLCVETYEPRGKDWMLDVEVTSNRPDCLSHLGIAREVAALTGQHVQHPDASVEEDSELRFEDQSSVIVECPDLCPHYTARIIEGITVGESPPWMKKRLETCGIRPINNIVDVTNYILLESGQPLHAFDMARLTGRRIVVRRAEEGEEITTIDESVCELSSDMCIISDAENPVALAGIMGGLDSEIGASTVDVLIESARFNPPNVRRTSRELGLSSESSYRFERGVDPENVEKASRRAAKLILELAGGELVSGMADIRADTTSTPEVTIRLPRLAHVLGLKVAAKDVEAIFSGLELEVLNCTNSEIAVRVPSWRPDLTREIDLIEEVARLHGYDKVAETTRIPVAFAPVSRHERAERKARSVLAGQGFTEIMTYSLVTPTHLQCAQCWYDGDPIALRNPVSSDKTHLRLTNLANMLRAKRVNAAHGNENVDLYELGKIYLPDDQELPEEKVCLSLLTDREDGFLVLKGVLKNLLDLLHVDGNLGETPAGEAIFEEPESIRLELEGQLLGCAGVLPSKYADELDFPDRPALLEIDFDLVTELARLQPAVTPLPKYPPVERDIAIVIDESVLWRDVERCIRDNSTKNLEAIDFFDLYRGEQIPMGKKSIAFSVTFRSEERTLTREEADAQRDEIVCSLESELNAELR